MFNPKARGYHAAYHEGEVNHCPGCGRTHWHIGRLTAECAFCSTALPLMATLSQDAPTPRRGLILQRGAALAVAA